MRYLVRARLKRDKGRALARAIATGTLGRGSVAGGEYLRNMAEARQMPDGSVHWVETCFCEEPLAEERPYWEEYFQRLRVTDAHARDRCRHESGEAPWACSACDCTRRLDAALAAKGRPFSPGDEPEGLSN